MLRPRRPRGNSLRSLRSLSLKHSPGVLMSRRAARAPPGSSASRRLRLTLGGYRPPRQPPPVACDSGHATRASAKSVGGGPQRACEAARSTGLAASARTARASTSDSAGPERSERSERSELHAGPQDRAPQRSRAAGTTAEDKRCGPSPGRLCLPRQTKAQAARIRPQRAASCPTLQRTAMLTISLSVVLPQPSSARAKKRTRLPGVALSGMRASQS
jgi:hypothetical protein